MAIETPWMTVKETAEYSKSHPQTVLKALNDGKLRGSQTKKNGRWLIHRDAVDEWVTGDAPRKSA